MEHNYVLIMAGGAGTRLWPLSRKARPKQFQNFTGEQTLVQHIVNLTTQVVPLERTFLMATPQFRSVILEQIPKLPEENILFEPSRRDNGPAITLGMLQIQERDPEARVAILWSDHLINEAKAFATILETAFQAAGAHPLSLITIGAKPTAADVGMGYIQMGDEIEKYNGVPVFRVKKFIEKPDLATATRFISSWEYLWNLGYKIMGTKQFIAAFKRVQPSHAKTVEQLAIACRQKDEAKISALYETFPKLSIEHLFTPFLTDLLVVPGDIGWSDVGNWNILHEVLKKQSDSDLVSKGEVLALDSKNSLVFAQDRLIALVGVKDLIVVDDGDTVLVMSKAAVQTIKSVTQALETNHQELL